MILYYSSTGNSYHVAREIHKRYPGRIIDMAKPEGKEPYVLADDEILFIVTFNCFWGVSELVKEFFKKRHFSNVKKIVAIITCGGYLGSGDYFLNRILRANNLPQAKVYDLVMVTNYVVLHEVPEPSVQKQLLATAENRLHQILSANAKPYRSSLLTRLVGTIVHALYSVFRCTKPFTVSEACVACGKCARDCPVQAIELFQGHPVWQKRKCDHCLKCLHNCPVAAINYGRLTLGKKRYKYPKSDGPLLFD